MAKTVMQVFLLIVIIATIGSSANSQVQPGDTITPENAPRIADLVSPGTYKLVRQGMRMQIVAPQPLEWPPPYKSATEQYSAQVGLSPDGRVLNYIAGQPFPLLDLNDPQAATKIMWNFNFRPLASDDLDLRFPDLTTRDASGGSGRVLSHFLIGHLATYSEVGRTEVNPMPVDPDFINTQLTFRMGAFPYLEPSDAHGFGVLVQRSSRPNSEDNVWIYNPKSRKIRRESAVLMSEPAAMMPSFGGSGGGGGGMGAIGGALGGSGASSFINMMDPNSYFGFVGKVEDYRYRLLGEKQMLACVHARNSPAVPCPSDGSRTVCPEDWEMRHVYIVEITAKPGFDVAISKRLLYIDTEGWFATASDQYDRAGKLWKALVAYYTYRDRPVPDAKVAIYPFKRIFETAQVVQDLNSGLASTLFMPGRETPERECWYINMGALDRSFFVPEQMVHAAH
jgi:hypothetical protein